MDSAATQSGFSLVEMLVAVALSALIGMAGFTMVESILRVERSTDGRLDRLAEMQRAMHIMKLDFEQATGIQLAVAGPSLSVSRENETGTNAPTNIRYELRDQNLYRSSSFSPQLLITGVKGLYWRFYITGQGWLDRWPVPSDPSGTLPRAIAIDLEIVSGGSGPAGPLRRVIELPAGSTP